MDKVIQVVSGIGEVGVDTEASPGNGQYYVKLYDGSYDACGFDTLEEALAELDYVINQDTIDDSFPMSLEYDDDVFEGEYL